MDKGQLIFNVVVDFNSESFFIGKKKNFLLAVFENLDFSLANLILRNFTRGVRTLFFFFSKMSSMMQICIIAFFKTLVVSHFLPK